LSLTAVVWGAGRSEQLATTAAGLRDHARVVIATGAELVQGDEATIGGVASPVQAYERLAGDDQADVVVFVRDGLEIDPAVLHTVASYAATQPYVIVRDEDDATRWEDVLGYGRPAAIAVGRGAFLAAGRPVADFGPAAELELLLRIGAEPAVVYGLRTASPTSRACLVAGAHAAGMRAPSLIAAHRQALERLPIGGYPEAAPFERAVRRLLLRLRVAPRLLPSARSASERYAYWRAVARVADADAWKRLTHCTTILMYHAFGERGEAASRLVVPGRRFRRQLWWLRLSRRPVLSFGEYAALRRAGELPPARAVVITIDDGYLDNCTIAFPALRSAGARATFFVVTGKVGERNEWDPDGELAGRALLDVSALRELAEAGIEIGNHTRTHPHLPALAPARVREELVGGEEDLKRLGLGPARVLAYPHGLVSPAVEEAARKAGFLAACGVEAGLNCSRTPIFALRRTIVDGRHTLVRFAISLASGDPLPLRAQVTGLLRWSGAATGPHHRPS
jgi:peptidoglycan/xylan/chitin deacetylase (PgdA/CDA1 family)